ncbi:MAG TPA: hypothetical protein VJM08_01775 [Anaerolineales bacterium]|nr:hypothetical protein [Anaerolineales bacterium]
MTEFEKILEQCLLDLEMGVANVDECLNRYPGHALQLGPVLLTHTALERVGEMQPPAEFKARVRAKLTQQMQAHPRKSRGFNFAFMRLAMNFAIILLALLATGTAYAQSALPGDTFYSWKIASENAWRVVSSDPVGTDLAIAERRKSELVAIGDDPVLQAQVLEDYLEVAARLKSEMTIENEARILQTLASQAEELEELGIIDEEVLPPVDEILPTPVEPIETLLPLTENPQVNPTLPVSTPSAPEVIPPLPTEVLPVNPTELPEIIPTVQIPSEIVPTLQVPSILPTIKVPTLLP